MKTYPKYPCLLLPFLLCVVHVNAVVVLDDYFTDGNRSNQSVPSSSAWFYSGTPASNLVAASSSLQWTTTTSSLILSHFTSQTVATGESITLQFSTVVSGPIVGIQSGLRVGLFNSGGSQISADGYGISNILFQGYAGYGAFVDAGYISETESRIFRRLPGSTSAANSLMGSGYPSVIGGAASGSQLVAGKTYAGILTIRNNGTTSTITLSLNGVVLSTVDANHYTTFDTVAFFATQGMAPLLKFTNIKITREADAGFPAATGSSTPAAVPTFESAGVYWSPAGGALSNECQVTYRKVGTTPWLNALPLYYDARNNEYRGSVVSLKPNTSYEIKLLLAGTGTTSTLTTTTWNTAFPIASTVTLAGGTSTTPYTISTGGSATGYVLYAGAADGSTVIDVGNLHDSCVTIQASYVILRNVTLKGAKINGVLLDGAMHDVVIEENDISGWGRIAADGWGENVDAGIRTNSSGPFRVIIQRNKIHHPRSNANDWSQIRTYGGQTSGHPVGPQGITFYDTAGNHVIRFNEIYSDETHRFNDGMGGATNFSYLGFPGRDSDIYGNIIGNACDDALEIEGGGRNVRVWNNYMDTTYTGVSSAGVSMGPTYIFRNVMGVARESGTVSGYGVFAKNADKGVYGMGPRLLLHNTLLQPEGSSTTLGCRYGFSTSWTAPLTNTTSLNNIWHISAGTPAGASVADSTRSPTNYYDYDLCNGSVAVAPGQETSKVVGAPVYASGNGPVSGSGGLYALDPTSPGFDEGLLIPNFNDGFTGAAPDIGAHEAGTAALQLGVNAIEN